MCLSYINQVFTMLFKNNRKIEIWYKTMAISTNRPDHRATDVSDWGPNEFFIKPVKKSKYISLRKSIIK